MDTRRVEELGIVDPSDEEYWKDIHGTLAPLREHAPVARSTVGLYEILRYEHCEPLLRDSSLHQALSGMLAYQSIDDGPLYDWWQLIMNNHDAPTHTRLRSLVGRAFTPRQVDRIRDRIRVVATQLVDDLVGAGDVDLLDTFCHDLPLVVLCEMLGVPPSDHRVVEQWTTLVALAFSPVIPTQVRTEIERAVVEFNAYADDLIDRCRAQPGDDLLTELVHAEDAGDRLTRAELQALIINLLFAGHDTTKSMLSIGAWQLATHPDELAKLRADPSLMANAVEEIARFETPISGIPRLTTKDITVAGYEIPCGSYITMSVPSANRDPRRFLDPDRFDVTRTDARHLTFGFGVHHCVGASVARAEVHEGLAALALRVDMLPRIDEPEWVPFAAARRFRELPMVLSAR
jgi:cytochrome P450